MLGQQGDCVAAEPDTGDLFTWEHGEFLCKSGHAEVLTLDGKIIYLAGVARVRPFTGCAWAFFTPAASRHMASIAIETRRALNALPFRRVEYFIRRDAGLEASERYARALGFQLEAERMRKWHPDGSDYALYARIR